MPVQIPQWRIVAYSYPLLVWQGLDSVPQTEAIVLTNSMSPLPHSISLPTPTHSLWPCQLNAQNGKIFPLHGNTLAQGGDSCLRLSVVVKPRSACYSVLFFIVSPR